MKPVAIAELGLINWYDGEQFTWTENLYTESQVNAAVAAERDRCASLLENTDLSKLPTNWMLRLSELLLGLAAVIREE